MFFSLNQYIGFAIKYKDSYFSTMIYITLMGIILLNWYKEVS